MGGSEFGYQLTDQINLVQKLLDDAVDEGWTNEAIVLHKRYLSHLIEL